MNGIVCTDNNDAIGKDGKLLFHVKEDMKFFKRKTTGNIVIMGRKTFDSLPIKSKPLPNRFNIVLTRNNDFNFNGVYVAHNIDELKGVVKEIKSQNKDVLCFVIGGAEIYKLLEPYIYTYYVTRINHTVEDADAFFTLPEKMKIRKIRLIRCDEYPNSVIEEYSIY